MRTSTFVFVCASDPCRLHQDKTSAQTREGEPEKRTIPFVHEKEYCGERQNRQHTCALVRIVNREHDLERTRGDSPNKKLEREISIVASPALMIDSRTMSSAGALTSIARKFGIVEL